MFPCNKWLDKKEEDGKIERDLLPIESIVNNANKSHRFIGVPLDYEVYVTTSDIMNSGTDANVKLKSSQCFDCTNFIVTI